MAADKRDMTKPGQFDVLEYFRNGKQHKLIIATSEEGIDISKCNLVIRYDHVTNEIAVVQPRVPDELLNPRDVDLYIKAIEEGKERDRLVRVMVVGHFAQGKTTLTRRLFGQSVEGVESTNGIEVHSKHCDKNGTHWKNKPSLEHVDDMTCRLVNVASKLMNTDEQHFGDSTDITIESNGPVARSNEPVVENSSTTSSESEYDANSLESKHDAKSVESKYDKNLVAQFAQKMNASKTCSSAAMDQDDAIDINVWDFGGQFVYYATHQIFHSKNAIYLLVFNLKESFESMLIDEDFPNNKYTMKSCLEFWLESVHSFVGSNDGKEPTVILVGTHKGGCD
ncbi:uncharacterized protein LOC128548398 [Mercenaria mercenaria]|uniref:uncharacterized protein LOC128548398 n=1 Tax=Mercenaria mercenaria TaxID=6596 RepID=UPI00234EC531|nr:uncharacterized protein LOC128548398 [Mercenaria mercenaria]XP_053379028.1 uncharacterized protein LOC128548398 [Mercenaria mercenaria]